ncbi:MAG: TonB-dependent receptor plug domain-containing protein, partial [Pacificimonas sp.]
MLSKHSNLVAVIVAALPACAFAQADEQIVVTAARTPVPLADVAASLSVIDETIIEAVDVPQVVDLLRLAPGVSISRSGPTGAQTQVRLRGAEANHTLVFVDGIEANDPASGNEFRWEFLSAEGVERVELLRGPQSALWGSEALAGVVAVETFAAGEGTSAFGSAQYGSFDTLEVSAGLADGGDDHGVSLLGSWYDTDGIDGFARGPVERDGFDSLNLTAKAHLDPGATGRLSLVARYSENDSKFDGNDPVTFQRADTANASEHRAFAVRGAAAFTILDTL